MGSNPQPEFSRPVEVSSIGPAGLAIAIQADEAERGRLARRLGVVEVKSLAADATLAPRGAGIVLTASWRAVVVQECVVTLEPLEARLAETFELLYGPDAAAEPGGEIEIDPLAADPPEPITGGRIDVGEAVTEQLALAIDPYPRRPGVAFEADAEGETTENPFAALGALRRRN